MKPKIGLVIQGALTSIGRTGDKLRQTPEELKKTGGIIEYDTRENINRIIKEYGHLFDEIIVSVFDNQLKPGESFPGAKIVSAPDPGGIKQQGHYKDNNKVRQFLSTLNGLKELEKSGVDYAVKARTDTFIDFDKLLQSFFAGDTNKIGVTVLHRPNFLLHDLYFVAKLDVLKKFCEAILAYGEFEFISSVHREIILKPAHVMYKDVINVPDWAYFPHFPPDGVSAESRKVFNYMFDHVFFSLDQKVWRETLWRGTLFSQEHFRSLLGSKDGKQRGYDLPALITTDWKRYHAFRERISGVKPLGIEVVKAKAGEWGWQLWNLARQVVRYFL